MQSNLFQFRKEKGYTQQEIADISGISLRTYQYAESGSKIPKMKTVFKLAKILNCSIEDLFN